MERSHPFHLHPQLAGDRFRQRHSAVLLPLAVHREDSGVEVEIAYPQLQAFEQPQAATEQQVYDQTVGIVEMLQDCGYLLSGKHHGNVKRFPGS